ncbi:MAG: GWxTD domain-containing protein [Bacteroidia bacterium]|nr:GWxTD domain-containing protein [Bacteroidia bacterium]
MKRILLLAALISLNLTIGSAKNLQALFSFKTFYSPENGPYIETYLSVNGKSVVYSKNANGMYQGAIEITATYKDAEGIRHSDKYNLLSPEVKDTNNLDFSFLDQQRVQLPNGKYVLELVIRDKNIPEKPYNVTQPVKIEYYNNIVAISDIELLESYTKTVSPTVLSKSGFDLIPFADNFYGNSLKSLKFYAEVYNTDKVMSGSPYLLSYFIETAESKRVIEAMRGFIKQNPEKVNVLLREIPITDLPSGNYNLVLEVRNQQNELIATNTTFFQRSNIVTLPVSGDFQQRDVSNTFASAITNKDSLIEYIHSLTPIANQLEQTFLTNQMKLADVKIMQQFFYDFWSKRSPVNPEKAWMDYRIEVMRVNNDFSTRIAKGYTTERGRVYLKYGPPNTISKNYSEPSAYPYEIWHYYKIEQQSNRKFVFYNPDLVTNDFILLHSDAQGEPNNDRWELEIYKRDTQSRDYDEKNKGADYFGNKAGENFSNPR